MPRFVAASVSLKRSAAGRVGGLQTFLRYGREGMSQRGRLGGRPRLPTLAELEGQFSAPGNYIEGGALPGGISSHGNGGALNLEKRIGELAACPEMKLRGQRKSPGSPEGVS